MLRLVAGYFAVSGVSTVAAVLVLAAYPVCGASTGSAVDVLWMTRSLLGIAYGVALLFVEHRLRMRARSGAFLAAVVLALPLFGVAVRTTVSAIVAVANILGLPALALVWNELGTAKRRQAAQ